MILETEKKNQKNIDLKKLLFATLGGGFSMWILAGLWHTILALHFYKSETNAEHEGLTVILIAYLILGLLMSFFYSRFRQSSSILEGFSYGAIMGILWVFPHELAMAGAHGDSISYVLKNGMWHMVEQGAGGVIISLIYKITR